MSVNVLEQIATGQKIIMILRYYFTKPDLLIKITYGLFKTKIIVESGARFKILVLFTFANNVIISFKL